MTATRSLAAALALGSVLGISCYSEPLPPSTYRYACEGNGDCLDDEICRRGLCERPCTQLDEAAARLTEDPSDDPCPREEGYAFCFNGACASTCEVGANFCAPGQECIDLGLDLGGGGNPFGGGSDAPIGICGVKCDDADNADVCPEGEVCVTQFGACAVDCSQGQACPDGYTCFFDVCAPDDGSGQGSMGIGPTDDEERRR
jgi:hypothetical protein